MTPHVSSMICIDHFLKHRRITLRIFPVLWDNKFLIENHDIPLVGIKFFDTRNFLKHRRVALRNFSAPWDKNFSRENRDTLLHKVQKSVVELICKNSLKTNIKTVVLFLIVCKNWSNLCIWAKNMPVLSGRLVQQFQRVWLGRFLQRGFWVRWFSLERFWPGTVWYWLVDIRPIRNFSWLNWFLLANCSGLGRLWRF